VLCCVEKQKVGQVQTRAKYEGAMREHNQLFSSKHLQQILLNHNYVIHVT